MSAAPTPPGLYRPPVSRFWWLHRRSYLLFVLREVSCVFVAWSVVFLLLMVDAVHAGDAAYQRFTQWAQGPWVLTLNVVALIFVVFHAITWFNLAPQAMVVRMRGRRLAPGPIAAAHYAAWAVGTAVIAWRVLGGR